jgi:hypothetical protein
VRRPNDANRSRLTRRLTATDRGPYNYDSEPIDRFQPPIRIAELDERVRLGLPGFRDAEGATLQEAADALIAHILHVAAVLRARGVGPLSSECGADPAMIDFIWKVGEHAQAGGDPRELLFGTDSLAP